MSLSYDKLKNKFYQIFQKKSTLDADVGALGYVKNVDPQVQADWEQDDSSEVDFIKNKPTTVSEFTNDAGYLVQSDISGKEDKSNKVTVISNPTSTSQKYPTDYAVQQTVNSAISGVTQFDYKIVETLPATGVKGTIYLVPNSKGTQDVYDEYLYITSGWEKIGTTKIDLTDYATIDYVDGKISDDIGTHDADSDAHSDLFADKQDVIDDLDDIRDGAELGSTAVQPNDNITTLTNNAGYQTSANVETAIQNALNGLADAL